MGDTWKGGDLDMSSACACHTDEWCFYCEMYVPLERKYNDLRREVMTIGIYINHQILTEYTKSKRDKNLTDICITRGRFDALLEVKEKLKVVIDKYETIHTYNPDGHGTHHKGHDTANQVVQA